MRFILQFFSRKGIIMVSSLSKKYWISTLSLNLSHTDNTDGMNTREIIS